MINQNVELFSERKTIAKIKITKPKKKQKQIINKYSKQSKLNLNGTNRINSIINNIKRKIVYQKGLNQIKIFSDINNLKNDINSSSNKNHLKIYLYMGNKFMNLIILLIQFLFLFCQCAQENILWKMSEITLEIKGSYNATILRENFLQKYNPYEIDIIDSIYNSSYDENCTNNSERFIVKIKWNYTSENINKMFRNNDNIISIDLSNFNSSQIRDMSYLFCGCSSLKSINFDNFDTSNVVDMKYMFYG